MEGNIVYSFAYSNSSSAALIVTRLLKIHPDNCPQKSDAALQLIGCGFFPSTKAIVKFTKVGQTLAFQAPISRSSLGTVVSPSEVSCKPPKFGNPGFYDVSVALNGVDFTTDMIRVKVYEEPSLETFSPLLLDMRTTTNDYVEFILVG